MITAPPTTGSLRLTRKALAAWSRWLEKSGIDRRHWERLCELAAAEISALERLAENVRTAGPMPGWFDGTAMQMRVASAVILLRGLTLAERDLPAFLGLWPASSLHIPVWMERAITKHFEATWAAEKVAERLQQQRRDQERTAREAVIRAEQEREQEARIAQAAAEFEARQAHREQERKTARQGQNGDQNPMGSTTLNGAHPLNGTPPIPPMPDRLSPLETDIWEALRARHMDPRVEVSTATKREIARLADSTEGSVSQALASVRRKMRAAAETALCEETPPLAEAAPPSTAEATAPESGPAVHVSTPSVHETDPRVEALSQRVQSLETELDQVTADRAKAWEELHDLKHPAQPSPAELTERLATLEREHQELQTRYLKALEDHEIALQRRQTAKSDSGPRTTAMAPLGAVDGLDREASLALRRMRDRPTLTGDQHRTVLQLIAAGGDNGPSDWAEMLRRAADAVEVVLA